VRIPTATLPDALLSRLLLLIAASTLTALLLGEVGLRLIGQSYYWAYAKRVDPQLGWRPPPDSQGWQRFEGAALVSNNRLGFRDRDHRRAKPEGVRRIVVLGDSFTEAVQVPLEQTWWQRLGEQLNGHGCGEHRLGGPVIEVLNFAVSGYSTAQSLIAWRHLARDFSPDLVILAFFVGNDLNENQPQLDQNSMRPYFIAEADGLRLERRFLDSAEYRAAVATSGRLWQWLREHSRIIQLVLQARDARRIAAITGAPPASAHAADLAGAQPRVPTPGSAPAATAGPASDSSSEFHLPQELGVDNAIYRAPSTPAWEQAWRATEAMIGQWTAEVRGAGAEPLLMIIGSGAQVHPNAGARQQFAARLGVPDLGYPVRRLLEVAAKQHLPVINLPAHWTADARYQRQPLHGFEGGRIGFGHWNPAGHQAAAEVVSEHLCRRFAERLGYANNQGQAKADSAGQ
jgi:lysophospholipase L1-like esterase